MASDPSQKDRIKQELAKLLKNAPNKSPEDKKNLNICSFQLQVINFMYPDTPLSKQEVEQKIENVLKSLLGIYEGQSTELVKYLMDILNRLKVPQASGLFSQFKGLKIIDTDDADRLLNLGSIGSSCQNVNGNSVNCKCLLSYILDGKNRAMIVTDKEGKMIARAIIRLLWDPIKLEPILMKERNYTLPELDPAITKALDDACKRRALELNLALVSAEDTGSKYPNVVCSLDGRAPSEYVDAGPGRTSNQWSLSNIFYMSVQF